MTIRLLLALILTPQAIIARDSYLFAGFKGNGADGVYFALSDDGYRWELLNDGKPFVRTRAEGELMRDPHLARGPNGDFHLVWTWSWNIPAVVGHASSPDLTHWSEHKALPVMARYPEARNVWAPELYYENDKKRWLIIWSSTVPKAATEGGKAAERDHRIYSVTTPDFETLSDAKVFFDPGFSVIDGTILAADGRYYLVFKDEREQPLRKVIQYASGRTIEGPWTDISPPLTEAWNEGPSAIKIGSDFLIYFDHYRNPQHYGAIRSRDLRQWTDVTRELVFPAGLRHGSFLAITEQEAAKLRGVHPAHAVVARDGSGDFKTVQQAVDAAPAEGCVIRIKPGVYREAIVVAKSNIELRGMGSGPEDVVLTYDKSAGTAGGTGKSASVTVDGDDFLAGNLTVENSFSRNRPLTHEGSQAVALRVNGDRAVFRRVRFLGYQDTLYANGKGCDSEQGPCRPARQYFADCYIEGNVDFIFGDSKAFFENCEIHSLAHSQVMITAQSKRYDGEQSGYVFDHCRLTAAPGAAKVYLGRPWRSHASVVYLNTYMGPEIASEGWHEWVHDDKPSLPTTYYAEYKSSGPGANPAARDSHSKQLSDTEASQFEVKRFLAGTDGWDPTQIQ